MSAPQDPVALLDVNVLIALVWPNHEAHLPAREWFTSESARAWATCPVTETGFVRVSSNRRALPASTSPGGAVDMLDRLTSLRGHTFWPDDVARVTDEYVDPGQLRGHRQVTDAHLVALCVKRHGRLITFDRAIGDLVPGNPDLVHVLSTR